MIIPRDIDKTPEKFLCPVCKKEYQKRAWFEQHIQESIDSHAIYSGDRLFFQTELEEFFELHDKNRSLKERLIEFFDKNFKPNKEQNVE